MKEVLRFALGRKVQQAEQWSLKAAMRMLNSPGKALVVFSLPKALSAHCCSTLIDVLIFQGQIEVVLHVRY